MSSHHFLQLDRHVASPRSLADDLHNVPNIVGSVSCYSDPDPDHNLNTDPDPGFFLTLPKNFKQMFCATAEWFKKIMICTYIIVNTLNNAPI